MRAGPTSARRTCARLARRCLLLLAVLALLAPAASAEPDASDPPGRIEFVGRNLLSTANGVFHAWRVVDQSIDPDTLDEAWATVEVELASLDTGIERRDDHLRHPDFFGIEEHPVARVRVHSARPDGTDEEGRPRFTARFDVELHGVRKTLDGEVVRVSEVPLAFEGGLVLDRTDFDIGPPPSRWNPMSVAAEVPVRFRFEPGLETDG